jgi:hypothetical protein
VVLVGRLVLKIGRAWVEVVEVVVGRLVVALVEGEVVRQVEASAEEEVYSTKAAGLTEVGVLRLVVAGVGF